MKTKIKIEISDVEYGKNNNHLHFKCKSSFDSIKSYYITFYGTDLETNIPLVYEDVEMLIQMLKDDYGYAPFEIIKAKETIKNKHLYYIES